MTDFMVQWERLETHRAIEALRPKPSLLDKLRDWFTRR